MAGIHHVTLVTRHAQENFDFYAGFLGLRLVKQTAGFEDVLQLHLFYGDTEGSPGTLVTFLVWEDGAPGRAGHGQASELALAVPRASIGAWLTKALTAGIVFSGPRSEFGEPVLRLVDPDGIAVKLVGTDGTFRHGATGMAAAEAITGIRGVQMLSEHAEATIEFLGRHAGYRRSASENGLTRLVSPQGDCIDVRDAAGFWPGVAGTGMIDHVAFRAPDDAEVDAIVARLEAEGDTVTPRKHRGYFASAYVREPGGILLEFATDGPGMAVDEAADHLGEHVFVPQGDAAREADIRLMLPSLARPGEPRDARLDLPFVHRLWRAPEPDGSVLVLFHGQGGTEVDLMPLAHRAAPHADLLALRGRSTEDGTLRWFRRDAAGGFDEADIRREAEAMAATLAEAFRGYGLDGDRATLLGYSNGANFAASLMLLQPGLVRQAALLRPVAVLADPPTTNLSRCRFLLVEGGDDPLAADSEALVRALERTGAAVTRDRIAGAGHGLTAEDPERLRAWLAAAAPAGDRAVPPA